MPRTGRQIVMERLNKAIQGATTGDLQRAEHNKILTSPTYTAYWNGISKATAAIVPVALICAVT